MIVSHPFKVMGKERADAQKEKINTWRIRASVMSSGKDINQAH